MPGGRPTTYSQEMADRVCAWVADGNSLRSFIFSHDDTPTHSTLYKWMEQQPEFAAAFARARESMAHADADRINAVVEAVEARTLTSDQARVMGDLLKWTASRRLPKVYGDKLQVGAGDGGPIVVRWADGSD